MLLLSVLAVATGFAARRKVLLVPALLGGLLLAWGMYLQADVVVMYFAVVAGFGAWVAAFYVVRRDDCERGFVMPSSRILEYRYD